MNGDTTSFIRTVAVIIVDIVVRETAGKIRVNSKKEGCTKNREFVTSPSTTIAHGTTHEDEQLHHCRSHAFHTASHVICVVITCTSASYGSKILQGCT